MCCKNQGSDVGSDPILNVGTEYLLNTLKQNYNNISKSKWWLKLVEKLFHISISPAMNHPDLRNIKCILERYTPSQIHYQSTQS